MRHTKMVETMKAHAREKFYNLEIRREPIGIGKFIVSVLAASARVLPVRYAELVCPSESQWRLRMLLVPVRAAFADIVPLRSLHNRSKSNSRT